MVILVPGYLKQDNSKIRSCSFQSILILSANSVEKRANVFGNVVLFNLYLGTTYCSCCLVGASLTTRDRGDGWRKD